MPAQPNTTTPFVCEKCGARQTYYSGDPTDITAVDVDAVECYACGFVGWVDDEAKEYRKLMSDQPDEPGCIEKSIKPIT